MANRSYLYSTNVLPGPNAKASGRKLIGISEWNYDIPLVFKLLLSGNPQVCPSSIWDQGEDIALIGDYATGVRNLDAFLSTISLPAAQPLIAEARAFLNQPENQNLYVVLECGEIFDMNDTPLFEQNLALLEELRDLQPRMAAAQQSLLPPPAEPAKPVGLLDRLLGRKPEPAQQPAVDLQAVYALGLGNWSNVLYFDFTEAQPTE
ncbi:MAG: hypothetical protein ACN6O6_11860 [Pseudomonas sp.]|uniref:DUF7822 domain-containing protein n=1 Tax=Pseudomonas sp. TaxID=306 RepID=UPI003D0DBD60